VGRLFGWKPEKISPRLGSSFPTGARSAAHAVARAVSAPPPADENAFLPRSLQRKASPKRGRVWEESSDMVSAVVLRASHPTHLQQDGSGIGRGVWGSSHWEKSSWIGVRRGSTRWSLCGSRFRRLFAERERSRRPRHRTTAALSVARRRPFYVQAPTTIIFSCSKLPNTS
jgi:hypothetical protein